MTFATYADLIRISAVRRILALGLLMRVPMTASGVIVALHVVGHLNRSYTEAGVVTTVLAVALAISAPWRGRALDRVGLRRTVAPSLVVLTAAWGVAPWVGYWPLVALVGVAGLFNLPSFTVVRQVLIGTVSEAQRRPALAIDAVVTEISFMAGPVLGVLAATYLPTSLALFLCQLAGVLAGLALWIADPPLNHSAEAATGPHPAPRTWVTLPVILVFAIVLVSSFILTSEDLGSVAAMREMGHTGSLGWVMALWAFGSAVGAVVYGAVRRHPPAAVLLALLGATTALVSLAPDRGWFTVLIFASGLFCAPTLTATIDQLSRLVPASVRGEAIGWHGSAITVGSALGAPLTGGAIDAGGWDLGFALGGLGGLAIALVVILAQVARRRTAAPAAPVSDDVTAGVLVEVGETPPAV